MPSLDAMCAAVIAERDAPPKPGPLEWRGWVIDGRLLEAPRKMRLSKTKARLMALFVASKGEVLFVEDIMAGMECAKDAVRTGVKELRLDIGAWSIVSVRGKGYRLAPTDVEDPLDVLIRHLEGAVAAAKQLRSGRVIQE